MSIRSSGTAVRPPQPQDQLATGRAEPSRALGRWATAAVIAALLIMITAGLLRASWMPPSLPMPRFGPPWELSVRVPGRAIISLLWVGGLLAVGGVAGGLAAVRRGMPVPVRTLIIATMIGVVALTVLPPIGSTDALDYAIYGHIAALGHSPYVMTPSQYRVLYHVRQGVPVDWVHRPSYYGPLATAEQLAAAKLGGTSLAATVFWLKLVNAIAFAGVAVLADRFLRGEPAARLRAHVLWTANPLLIWSLCAGGHLDVLAAAIGLVGLLICDGFCDRWTGGRPLVRALAAGVCVGLAADIKVDYVLFGLAIAVALWRKPGQLLAAAGGAALVLVPSYAVVGISAIKALAARASEGSGYGFYGFFLHRLGISLSYAVPLAACLTIPVALLALSRLPPGLLGRPAIRAALALSVTWLFLWPHQFAWYSVMIFCVLVFYPPSRLDWLALAWLGAITIADMPGLGIGKRGRLGPVLNEIQKQSQEHMAPLVMLAAATGLVVLCVSGRWRPAVPKRARKLPDPRLRGQRVLRVRQQRAESGHERYRLVERDVVAGRRDLDDRCQRARLRRAPGGCRPRCRRPRPGRRSRSRRLRCWHSQLGRRVRC
jgi:hypothetical protein